MHGASAPKNNPAAPGGINVLFGDGSVRFVKNTINANIWVQVNSINGGEVISADAY